MGYYYYKLGSTTMDLSDILSPKGSNFFRIFEKADSFPTVLSRPFLHWIVQLIRPLEGIRGDAALLLEL